MNEEDEELFSEEDIKSIEKIIALLETYSQKQVKHAAAHLKMELKDQEKRKKRL